MYCLRFIFVFTWMLLSIDSVHASAESTYLEDPEGCAGVIQSIEDWNVAFKSGDLEVLGSLYDGGAQLFPPNQNVVDGRLAIMEFLAGAVSAGVYVQQNTTEIRCMNEFSYEIGVAKSFVKDGETSATVRQVDSSRYLVIWRKIDGSWLIYRDIWNVI
ncbi:YybH family protein [Simiduia aestuariiviva]|nr:DUF4440 domain-containing protein [Simiduia aestuariiviva]